MKDAAATNMIAEKHALELTRKMDSMETVDA